MTTQKEKRPGGQARASRKAIAKTKSKHNAKSTATEAQRERSIAALKRSPKTSYDLRRIGVYQSPTRIWELRKLGYTIRTEFVRITDSDGFVHCGVARYHLEGVPDGQRTK